MQNEDIIKSIKREFRLGMNGVISSSMRDKGIDYKINFGLSLPQLRDIAKNYPQSKDIASYLWNENIRESRLLAPMLFPADEMDMDMARAWIDDIKYFEESDILSMFLFAKLPFANQLISESISSDNMNKVYFGFRLFIRMIILKIKLPHETISAVKTLANVYSENKNIAIAAVANDANMRIYDLEV